MSSLREWALALPADGRFTFTTTEARTHQDWISAAGTAAALERAEADRIIASPVRGFHVVLPLEDRRTGIPSWRLFLDPLMTHLGLPYYVGLLTAASIHGVSAQAAQRVQVVVPRQRRQIRFGRLAVDFVVRRTAAQAPVELVTTPSGRIRVATREVVGLDVVRYPTRAGGWDNVLTVIEGLAPEMRRSGIRSALALEPATSDLQRLGHLLDRVGASDVAGVLAAELRRRRVGWVPLAPGEESGVGGSERDARWRVIVNIEPRAD
jgi:predicted transcriptional regulator of viral defense system